LRTRPQLLSPELDNNITNAVRLLQEKKKKEADLSKKKKKGKLGEKGS